MSDLENITIRLRRAKIQEPTMPSEGYFTVLGTEAADRIEFLEAENRNLREKIATLEGAIDYVAEETGYYTPPQESEK